MCSKSRHLSAKIAIAKAPLMRKDGRPLSPSPTRSLRSQAWTLHVLIFPLKKKKKTKKQKKKRPLGSENRGSELNEHLQNGKWGTGIFP